MAVIIFRSVLLGLLFCYLSFTVAAFTGSAPVCQDTNYGRSCSLPAQVEILTILDGKLMVGCSNNLVSFSLDLQVDKYVDLSPEESNVNHCKGFNPGQLGNDQSLCTNFVKVIEKVPGDERVMVCGTNAFRPKCTLHSASNISSYEYMTESHHIDEGFSPYSNDSKIVATLTSNGRFFSGTKFDVYAAPQTIGMAPYPLQSDNTFTVQVPTSDQQWLKQPTFISSYEVGDHIYFFLREPAYEIDQGESIVYSRAVRICKNDNGTANDPNDPSNVFLTFQKARIVCSSHAESGSINSIPYNYDNLQSTFLWTAPDGQQFLYGVFTSPTNGPSGSAICKFSFDATLDGSLTKVFEDGEYLAIDPDSQPQITWKRVDVGSFVCPGDTTGAQRTTSDATTYQLVYSPVTALQPEPIYTTFGKRLTKLAVDVIHYNNESQTIIYFATAEGDIQYLIARDGEERLEAMVHSAGSPLSDLTVQKNADETRYLYVTTEDRVLSITLGDCSRYGSDCFACLDSRDAYCGWDRDTNSCKNKLNFSSSTFLQSAFAIEDDITGACGPRTDVPTPQTPVPPSCQSSIPQPNNPSSETQTEDNQSTDDQENTDCTVTGPTGGVSTQEKSVSVPDLVGATVGAFVVGIPVGAFVCFVFLKLFVAPRRRKHAINRQRRANQGGGDSGTVTHVNNHLSGDDQQQIQKKELSLKENPRYVQPPIVRIPPPTQPKTEVLALAPPPPGNVPSGNHKRTNSKDINTYMSQEDDNTFDDGDQVPPLRSISSCSLGSSHGNRGGGKPNGHSHTMNGVHRKRVPGHKVPRGRTESTTWLRANSLSSDPSSPLESPISDV